MPPPARRRPRAQRSYGWYLLPLGLLFTVVVLGPFLANVAFSLFRWRGGRAPMRFDGLGNYVQLLGDAEFWQAFQNSVFMILAITVVPTALGLLLAAVLFDYLGKTFGAAAISVLRGCYYLPQILPIAVAGFIWAWILATDDGALNAVLGALGVQASPDWLGSPQLAIVAVMLMLIWLQIGYPTVIFMAALERVDPELYEAAELDGAGWWSRFVLITVPQIRPEVFVVVLTATVAALKVFAPILILTGGGPEGSTVVPSYYAYRNFFELSQVGYGSTIATVMSLVIFVVAAALLHWQRRTDQGATP